MTPSRAKVFLEKEVSYRYASVDLESVVLSATPLELLILTYDRLINKLDDLIKNNGDLLSKKPDETHVLDLIEKGLMAVLNFKDGGNIAKNLFDIYRWAMFQISLGISKSDKNLLLNVQMVFRDLRAAWLELQSQEKASVAREL